MNANALSFHEITTVDDDLLPSWLELYETAFPPNERILVGSYLRLLRAKTRGEEAGRHLVATVDEAGDLAGVLDYEVVPDLGAAFLWYIAIHPQRRNQGLGTLLYQEMLRQLAPAGLRALIFEVEMPEEAETEERRALAGRRIGFYRRLGAQLLLGIRYLQHVGPHQPPVPMHIMVHPLQPLEAAAAFELTQAAFGKAVTQIGPLRLE